MISISALQIERWADQIETRHELPRLIRLLILGSKASVRLIDIPAGEGVQRHGWDGVVDCAEPNPWIPVGLSVWEIGTSKAPAEKASADFKKRSECPGDVVQDTTTFVFVTPRNWVGKSEWAQQRRTEGKWKDVRAYDAQDLEAWLEITSGPAVWLAESLGVTAAGIQSVAALWHDIACSTSPTLSTNVLVRGRETQLALLEDWLQSGDSILQIRSDSPFESAAFFASVMQTLSIKAQERWLSKTIVASTQDACRRLIHESTPLNILLIDGDLSAAGNLTAAGHRVILPLGMTARDSAGEIVLPRLGTDALGEVLREMGVEDPRAAFLAKSSGRSVLVVRRLLAVAASLAVPRWGKADIGVGLVSGLIAGGWDESLEGDRMALARLAGTSFEEILHLVKTTTHESDAPFRQVGGIFRLTAPLDAWLLLSKYISRVQFDRYREVVIEVLGTPDPRLDLPSDKRWSASLYGKNRPHSAWLREGLSEGLVLLAIHGDRASPNMQGRMQDWVNNTISSLLQDASAIQWASIGDQLPLLSEAAPEAFLDAIESDLERDNPHVMLMFEEEGDGIFGRCAHTGVLWALETLAWNPSYLTRVACILATLARLDPGGRWANRPLSSLKDIFISWLRHTAASLQEKLEAIDYIFRTEPDITWKLLLSLLPGGQDTSSGTERPRWRDWAQHSWKPLTRGESNQYVLALADRALAKLNDSSGRRADLLNHLASLPKQWGERLIANLDEFSRYSQNPDENTELWTKLRKVLHHHRSFPDAEWALPPEALDSLEVIYRRLEPINFLIRSSWLFDDAWPDIPCGRIDDTDAALEVVAEMRRRALLEIFASGGITLLIDLAKTVSQPHAVGLHAAEVLQEHQIDALFLATVLGSEIDSVRSFAHSLVARRHQISPGWTEKVLATGKDEHWQAEKLVDICLGLPVIRETWRLAARLGEDVDRQYWQRVSVWRLDEPADVLEEAVRKLLAASRPDAAFSLVEFSKRSRELLFGVTADILDGLVASKVRTDLSRRMREHDFERLFCLLDGAVDRDDQRLAQLEWQYLPVIEHSKRGPRALHAALSEDPAFFAQAVALIFRSEGQSDVAEKDAPDEETRARAQQAYSLLSSWTGVPGTQNGAIDSNKLAKWIIESRRLLEASGHRGVGDDQIGRVLARAPASDDGQWPPEAVRVLLEQVKSRRIEQGILIGTINARGATWRGAGGAQERELEEKYRSMALQCAATWPRSARVLSRIADSYAAEAKHWDDDAMRDDLRWG